jgi:uncharacterized membrane protein YeaQ/YmgE (transglycosylase-associated protein family)
MENKAKCCSKNVKPQIGRGILYGILPHGFCIAFIIFSIIGATTFTSLLKPFMLNSYFFPLLIFLSFIFATLSAFIYLKRNCSWSLRGIKNNKNYLLTLYFSVIGVNLLLFLVIFPLVANYKFQNSNLISSSVTGLTSKTISVTIPCSGHAPLIMDEVKKDNGVVSVRYIPLNNFEIKYDPQKTSLNEILSLKIFESFKASEVYGK